MKFSQIQPVLVLAMVIGMKGREEINHRLSSLTRSLGEVKMVIEDSGLCNVRSDCTGNVYWVGKSGVSAAEKGGRDVMVWEL